MVYIFRFVLILTNRQVCSFNLNKTVLFVIISLLRLQVKCDKFVDLFKYQTEKKVLRYRVRSGVAIVGAS